MFHACEHRLFPALGSMGQNLCRGEDFRFFDVLYAALRRDIELTHRVKLGVEKLAADRRAERRVHIENAAAAGKLAHTFDLLAADVARGDELRRHLVKVIFPAEL